MTAPTLTEFLLARIAEDRVAAALSQREPHRVGHRSACDWWGDMPGYCTCDATARAIAECEAKRRIVEVWPDSFGSWTADQAYAAKRVKDAVLLDLAAVYADHPDYDEAWRP